MNRILQQSGFARQSAVPYSRFEKPEAPLSGSPAICVQFGGRLRRVFDIPDRDSQPDRFLTLLQQIESKLG